MGPLARRSMGRLIRSGVWGWLVAGAFVLLASAAAAAPLFAEASGNAALIARLAVVPSNALAADAPVVRLVGGVGTAGQYQIDDGFWRIPGLTRGFGTASSIGVETRLKSQLFTPYVRAGVPVPSTQPPDDPGRSARPTSAAPPAGAERARLYGDDDLVHALVPVAGSPRPGAAAGSVSGARPGV